MKKLIIVYLFPFVCLGQKKIEATYAKNIGEYEQTKVSDDKKLNPYVSKIQKANKEYFNEAKKMLKKLSFSFFTNGEECVFYVNNSGLLENNSGYNPALLYGFNAKGKYYSNITDRESIHQKSVFRETFLVKQPFYKVKWILKNERKQIGKFNCLKAVAELTETNQKKISKTYQITCWYTTEIPTNNLGPLGFNGLPGLIVYLKKGNTTLELKNLNVSNTDIKIEKPNKGIYMDSQDSFEKEGIKMFRKMRGRNRN